MAAPIAARLVTAETAHAAPLTTFSSRVHGLAVLSQDNLEVERVGNQAAFNFGAPPVAHWFHIPIPTPTIVEEKHAQLKRIRLNFSTPNIASQLTQVTSVHVYGRDFIQPFPGVLDGDQPGAIFTLATPHLVRWAISISIEVHAYGERGGIIFHGAGADFEYSVTG